MTEQSRKNAIKAERAVQHPTDRRQDLIEQSLKALFEGAEREPLPDKIAEILKRMAEEPPA